MVASSASCPLVVISGNLQASLHLLLLLKVMEPSPFTKMAPCWAQSSAFPPTEWGEVRLQLPSWALQHLWPLKGLNLILAHSYHMKLKGNLDLSPSN